MPADLCGLVAWTEFADLYPQQEPELFGHALQFDDPVRGSEIQCAVGYGQVSDPTAMRITVGIEVLRNPLLVPTSLAGRKKHHGSTSGQ